MKTTIRLEKNVMRVICVAAMLAAALAAQFRLQLGDREIAAARDEMARVQAMRMTAALAQHPEQPPRLHGVPQGLDRPNPMPHHGNN